MIAYEVLIANDVEYEILVEPTTVLAQSQLEAAAIAGAKNPSAIKDTDPAKLRVFVRSFQRLP